MQSIPFGSVWRLVYVDGQGRRSERIVEARSLTATDDDCDMTAFCRTRQAERTFRASRIAAMTNIETGEALRELGGIPIVSLAARDALLAEGYLSRGLEALGLADAIGVAAGGPPSAAIAGKVLTLVPPFEQDEGITAEALAVAIGEHYGAMGLEGLRERIVTIEGGVQSWTTATPDMRTAIVRLVGETLSQSSWPDEDKDALIETVARALSVTVRIRR